MSNFSESLEYLPSLSWEHYLPELEKMTKKTQILDFDHFTGFKPQNRPQKIDQRKNSVPEKVLESIF